MVVRAKTRWQIAVTCGVLGTSALLHYGLGLDGDVLATLALLPVVLVLRMRLSTDEDGVTIVNLVRRIRIPWAEITDVQMGRAVAASCLRVYRGDGRRVNAWVATTTGADPYSEARVRQIAAGLRHSLALRAVEPNSAGDDRAVAADRRDDIHVMAERLLSHAARLGDAGPGAA